MNCPHGADVGDPPHAVNCSAAPCSCLADCLAYEDQTTASARRAQLWPVWRWWADVRSGA